MGIWEMTKKVILKFLIPPKTTALVVREDCSPVAGSSVSWTGYEDKGTTEICKCPVPPDEVGYIVKYSGEQVAVGKYVGLLNGVRVQCVDTVEVSSHNNRDLFIKKRRFALDTHELLAERIEYLSKAQIKGLIRNGVFEPVPSLF